jgi:hypothetical protein
LVLPQYHGLQAGSNFEKMAKALIMIQISCLGSRFDDCLECGLRSLPMGCHDVTLDPMAGLQKEGLLDPGPVKKGLNDSLGVFHPCGFNLRQRGLIVGDLYTRDDASWRCHLSLTIS